MISFTTDDFARAFRQLLPSGLIWRKDDPNSVQGRVLAGLSAIYQRTANRGLALLADASPQSTLELLDEWETTLGLPDPCVGVQTNTELRRRSVLSRFRAAGGQSVPYFTQIAADLGLSATVVEYSPFRVEESGVETALNTDPEWSYKWRIDVDDNLAISSFLVDISQVDTPLRTWGGDNGLNCVVQRLRPAHTSVSVAFPNA